MVELGLNICQFSVDCVFTWGMESDGLQSVSLFWGIENIPVIAIHKRNTPSCINE